MWAKKGIEMALENIEHIVFLMLENRSFDQMLGYLSREDTPHRIELEGLQANDAWLSATANYETPVGAPHRSKSIASSVRIDDPPHGWKRVPQQMATPPGLPGPPAMGGFVKTYVDAWREDDHRRPADPGAVMGYYDASSVWAYDFLARNYCVCDRWFTPLPTGTQPNRLMGMGGHSDIFKNARPIIPRHDLVYNWLNRQDVDWRVYRWGGALPFFALMMNWWDDILGSEIGLGRFRKFDRLREHWAPGGEAPPVLFIEPAYSELRGERANDDHAPTRITGGQLLVADLYDILTGNPERWAKTLLIITYDEHGGFFDHVEPLQIRKQVDDHWFETSGPRVPALIVSPFVDPRQVFSDPVDHTAFLALLAEKFTPGVPYSDHVSSRQSSYQDFGMLSAALRASARSEPPPSLPRPITVRLVSGFQSIGIALPGRGAVDATPDARTPTAVAFDEAARLTAEKRPDLLADDEWDGLRHQLANPLPPGPTQDDHIGDE
jgi:phospholipase C